MGAKTFYLLQKRAIFRESDDSSKKIILGDGCYMKK